MSRLKAREPSANSQTAEAELAAGVLRRATTDLCRFIGADGCHALMVRALSQAHASHPPLENIKIIAEPELTVVGVPESIQAHGDSQTAAGVEAILVALIVLLARLIGDELAMKLVDPEAGQ